MIRAIVLSLLMAGPVAAEVVVAARTLPARSLIGPDDLLVRDLDVAGAVTDPSSIVGLEARVALYAGRPIRPGDVGPAAIVDRNQIIELVYQTGGLRISTEGRALDRAGPGERIRVMNVMSRQTVFATIDQEGIAHVSQ